MLRDIVPVILCGGAGRRLYPLSRPDCPKPFLKFGGPYSMLQNTLLRVRGCAAPVLILNQDLKDKAQEHAEALGITPSLGLLEPAGRNTAAALAAASLMLDDALMLVLPSDHWIGNPARLLAAVAKAAPLARQGWIISFGIRPTAPETRFGYIRRGPVVADGIHRIDRFIEKPPRTVAQSLVRGGTCDWNSGMFFLSAATARAELDRFEPGLLAGVRDALADGHRGGFWQHIGPGFASVPALSIDVAVMERSEKTLVVPVDLDWSDLGTWPAVIRHFLICPLYKSGKVSYDPAYDNESFPDRI